MLLTLGLLTCGQLGPELERWAFRVRHWSRGSGLQSETQLPQWAANRTQWLTHHFTYNVGLGNHMFVVASLVGIARTHSATHVPLLAGGIDTTPCDKRVFPALAGPAGLVACTTDHTVHQRLTFNAHPEISVLLDEQLLRFVRAHRHEHLLLHGYLQSFRYFQPVRNELRAHMRFADAVYAEAMQMLVAALGRWQLADERRVASVQVVGAHVRRGDYVNAGGLLGNRSPTADYYRASSHLLEKLCGQPVSLSSSPLITRSDSDSEV